MFMTVRETANCTTPGGMTVMLGVGVKWKNGLLNVVNQ